MIDFFNSDFIKLLSILLAIVALFYIGVKHKPTNGMSRSIHLWYICGIAAFVIVELATFIVVGNADAQNVMSNISFAATLSSLLLSVLAIFMTVLSGESMNKLRDSLIGLGSIPNDVKEAVKETIGKMQQSTENLNSATEASNKNLEELNEVLNKKISEIEYHILDLLNEHQRSTLKAITERDIVGKKEGTQTGSDNNISETMIATFLSTTSNASISLLYMIGHYCDNVEKHNVEPPVVNLKNLAFAINLGKIDDSFAMYLFACLVILSSFCMLDYKPGEDRFDEVTFLSINQSLKEQIPEQLRQRELNKALEGLNQYIDSLFLNGNNQKVDCHDGTEIG